MLFDVHVHIAQLGSHQATDRFLHRANPYVRMFLRHLRISRTELGSPQINATIQQRLLDWVSQSSIHRFVLLAMDAVYDLDGQRVDKETRWFVDNDFVAQLADTHPSLLLGASIHPYRNDAVEELQRVVGRGACLVKWIPSAQQIRLDSPRCAAFYEALAHYKIPLLVHTGNEHSSWGGANRWNNPELLRHPLEKGVTVIAAHCGTRMFLHERSYFANFCRMAREYERLYGDLAAFGIPTRITAVRHLQRNPDLLAKVVYGSDFPAFPMTRSFVLSIGRQAVREIQHEASPLERPYLLMRKMGMPDEVFCRAGDLLRLPASRGGDA